jgi:DDE family transposase
VVAGFDGGTITSEAGSLLLRQVEQRTGMVRQFAHGFRDYRDADKIEHSVGELIGQRIYGVALGYEDLNDHDQLRRDPLLAVLCGKADVEGRERRREQDRGSAGAGKSTLNRLELTPADADEQARYKKIVMDEKAVDELLVNLYIQSQPQAPKQIVLDLDATDDPVHGNQEGRFFHGYYGAYCYLPLYIFIGDQLVCARLRSSNIDASAGAVEEVERIVEQLRRVWPQVRIIVRADSGFCRDKLMNWCEQHKVDYVLGLAKNCRLRRKLGKAMKQARQQYRASGQGARVFTEFTYRTRKSWSRRRRVIGKAEYLAKGENPRFVVTSLEAAAMEARILYEQFYCARGEAENRIKEQQLGLFADRTSTAYMRSNQLRLYFSSIAYCLMEALRRLGLKSTEMAQAQCSTIRLRLLKIGAQIRITVRRIWISMAAGHPGASVFEQAWRNLQLTPLPG